MSHLACRILKALQIGSNYQSWPSIFGLKPSFAIELILNLLPTSNKSAPDKVYISKLFRLNRCLSLFCEIILILSEEELSTMILVSGLYKDK